MLCWCIEKQRFNNERFMVILFGLSQSYLSGIHRTKFDLPESRDLLSNLLRFLRSSAQCVPTHPRSKVHLEQKPV